MKIKYNFYETIELNTDIVLCKPDEDTVNYYNNLDISNITKVILLRHLLVTTLFRYIVPVFCSNISTIIKKGNHFCSLVSLSNSNIIHTVHSKFIEDVFREDNNTVKYDVENTLRKSFISVNITSNTTVVQLNSKMKDGGIGKDFIAILRDILRQYNNIDHIYGGVGVSIEQDSNTISNCLSLAVITQNEEIIKKLNKNIKSLSKQVVNINIVKEIIESDIQHVFTDVFDYKLSYILNN